MIPFWHETILLSVSSLSCAYLVFINELPFQDICGGSVAGIKKGFNEWGCH